MLYLVLLHTLYDYLRSALCIYFTSTVNAEYMIWAIFVYNNLIAQFWIITLSLEFNPKRKQGLIIIRWGGREGSRDCFIKRKWMKTPQCTRVDWTIHNKKNFFSRLHCGLMVAEWRRYVWRERWISVAFQSPYNDHFVDWMAGTYQWPDK